MKLQSNSCNKKQKSKFSNEEEKENKAKNSQKKENIETGKENDKADNNEDDLVTIKNVNYETTNLNLLTTYELNKHKKIMEKQYEKNAILPGSEDFVYDVEKNFNCGDYDNEWDDDEEI